MLELILGGLTIAVLFMLLNYTKQQSLAIAWWKWVLTILGLLFAVFTIEVIAGFLMEDAAQAALVLGLILGIITIIWGVLLNRFVFKKTA